MNRRRFLAGGCACGAGLLTSLASAQASWEIPARFTRPDASTDEGGLWSLMDREETKLRRSPFSLRDPQLQGYIRGIVCRLAGEHCPDVRVHIVRTPLFNASMAPNGMMQVWTGLLLRVENEAQLAAVLGHELGHYLARHSVERLRDAKSRSAFGQFVGLFGVVGAIGQLGMLAGMFAYSREHERDADRISITLMHNAGYDPGEAAKVWGNLLLEVKARPDEGARNALFATHPAPEDRREELANLAEAFPGGVKSQAEWRQHVRPYLREWMTEEVKRGQHEETIVLLTRFIANSPGIADYSAARAETYRLRGKDNDFDMAIADYRAAAATGGEPPEIYRGLGMIHRLRNQPAEARINLLRYLELAPDAPDSPMIKSYMEELRT